MESIRAGVPLSNHVPRRSTAAEQCASSTKKPCSAGRCRLGPPAGIGGDKCRACPLLRLEQPLLGTRDHESQPMRLGPATATCAHLATALMNNTPHDLPVPVGQVDARFPQWTLHRIQGGGSHRCARRPRPLVPPGERRPAPCPRCADPAQVPQRSARWASLGALATRVLPLPLAGRRGAVQALAYRRHSQLPPTQRFLKIVLFVSCPRRLLFPVRGSSAYRAASAGSTSACSCGASSPMRATTSAMSRVRSRWGGSG